MSALPTLPAIHETGIIGEDTEAYRALARLLDGRNSLHLRDVEGNAAPVPPELRETLRTLVSLLAANRAALITPTRRDLTTQQAANLLGLSRPTLIRLLDEGAMPYTRLRSHRRIHLTDLLAYREVYRTERQRRLTELMRIGEEIGGYDVTEEELAAFRTRMERERAVVWDDDAAE